MIMQYCTIAVGILRRTQSLNQASVYTLLGIVVDISVFVLAMSDVK